MNGECNDNDQIHDSKISFNKQNELEFDVHGLSAFSDTCSSV